MNTQDIDTPLGRGRPRLSRWIRKKGPGLLKSGPLLLDDNARPHTVTAMQNHIATLDWEPLHYPPYTPDLAPSDFHLFPALKKNLAGRVSAINAEVKQAVKRFFLMQSLEFSVEDCLKLIKLFDKCLNVLDTCMGKKVMSYL
ncbi:histone-lysine N-methyltransferase SETMAR [Trichonephila clavipes]|nr:histone-lysine N-methyltransferase SETMAR [Trichonephila clavipes]